MSPEERMMMAAQLRAAADRLLLPVAAITQLPPSVVQGFVEGATTGAVAAAKAPKKRKASAYNKAFANAYKRLKKKHPRSKHATLMKRAHVAARKAVKK
jgi:hypothetical protein